MRFRRKNSSANKRSLDMTPMIDCVFQLLLFFMVSSHFDEEARTSGEGSLDAQSLSGKAPVGVARVAASAGVPVTALVGRLEVGPEPAAKKSRASRDYDGHHPDCMDADIRETPQNLTAEVGRVLTNQLVD